MYKNNGKQKVKHYIYIYIYITVKISFQNNQPLRINEGRHSFAGSESIGKGIPDGVNTLVYTILKHFVGTPSNISSQISDYILHYCLLGWFYFAYFIFNIILLCFRLQRCVPSPFMVSKPD